MSDINKCCICGHLIVGRGHDPSPLIDDDYPHNKVCCDYCYTTKVVPYTIRMAESNRLFSLVLDITEGPDDKLILTDVKLITEADD